jgi:hypothetical protein
MLPAPCRASRLLQEVQSAAPSHASTKYTLPSAERKLQFPVVTAVTCRTVRIKQRHSSGRMRNLGRVAIYSQIGPDCDGGVSGCRRATMRQAILIMAISISTGSFC